MERHELTGNDAKSYVTAGNALVTIENAETGVHFTYKVRHKDNKPCFVSLLTGSNNTSDFTFIGAVFVNKDAGTVSTFKHSPKSRIGQDAKGVAAFNWVWTRIVTGRELPASVHIYHHGTCGRCGRTLTTPESINRGLGPECAKAS